MGLSKAQILAADDLPIRKIKVKEWGGEIALRCLSGQEASDWYSAGLEGIPSMCMMIALSAIDDDGERLFENDDVEALGKKNPNALRVVFDAALSLSALDGEADSDAEKN